MSKSSLLKTSKFLALVLRHDPSAANVCLDREGWTSVSGLLQGLSNKGFLVSHADLAQIVAGDGKRRYSFSDDGLRIRANQGHSSPTVDLSFTVTEPPERLYHGTHQAVVETILREGLLKMSRHHVHLSGDIETARIVGSRRGKPIILPVDAATMCGDGYLFYLSANGVWLTDIVPPQYLSLI